MQHEITSSHELLDEKGNIIEPGYAKHLLPVYSRSKVKCNKTMRLKEWDYYLISNAKFALALTIDNNGYMNMNSVSVMDFERAWTETKSPMKFFPGNDPLLPETSAAGDCSMKGRGYWSRFENNGSSRRLSGHMDGFFNGSAIDYDITLTDAPDESIVICTPFNKDGHFYFNQKLNCMRAEGSFSFDGRTYSFSPEDSFAVLDWGRGVWTYHNTWYWGSASYVLEDGIKFGWNIGYGFGDTSAATENMLFYNGKAHKLSNVKFNIPGEEKDFMSPWTFTSDDGRFEMDFVPVIDRASCTDVGIIKSDQHQVFGRFTGKAVLDDGTVINVKDFPGFAEKVENKW